MMGTRHNPIIFVYHPFIADIKHLIIPYIDRTDSLGIHLFTLIWLADRQTMSLIEL